jgi:hypothetical protein
VRQRQQPPLQGRRGACPGCGAGVATRLNLAHLLRQP